MIHPKHILLGATFIFAALPLAKGGAPTPEADWKTAAINRSPFSKGSKEFQVLAGTYFSFSPASIRRTTENFAIASFRLGLMLSDPKSDGFFRGNWEFVLEGYGGGVFDGPGNGLGGATMQLRYNFVQSEARWIPYYQIGGGLVYSDIYKTHTQGSVGTAVNFDLRSAVGLRYRLTDSWAIVLEAGYLHFSNAGLSTRNAGINSVGAELGVCHFF